MALNFSFTETKNAHPSMTFSEEFVKEFDQAWGFLKENPGHQATVIFENATARDKWFNTAKVYGSQHPEDIFVSKVKGSGSDDKTSGKLVFKMEDGASRDKRIAAQKKRIDMAKTVAEHGLEVKRGIGTNLDEVHAALMKKTPEEREAMRKRHAAKNATPTAPATPAAPKPTPKPGK